MGTIGTVVVSGTRGVLQAARRGDRPSADAALSLLDADLPPLLETAAEIRERGHGRVVSYSRKVFIPLTKLCRDVCHYCTFARPPRRGERAYLTIDEVVAIARAGAAAGCHEALFTLGDKPERRYAAARRELAALGHATTLSYLIEAAGAVLRETGLLPHANPGVMSAEEIVGLRRVTASQGIMLESASLRLLRPGMPHHGSPDKPPARRLETIRLAGELAVPFTSGILIGIGETRAERVEALLALRDLHDRYGHLQEVIVQPFRAKPGTRMARAPEPEREELLWTVAVARVLFGPGMGVQSPPNLEAPEAYGALVAAGISDWGGVSPVTPDHVNPERPWPNVDDLRERTAAAGKVLVERLAVYPAYVREGRRWIDDAVLPHVLRAADSAGFARDEAWSPGVREPIPAGYARPWRTDGASDDVRDIVARGRRGIDLDEADVVRLFAARGADFDHVCRAADELRAATRGDTVTYVVTRNINYTNVCYFRCQFCAFSKGRLSEDLRGTPYDLEISEIARRAREAWDRGGTEVCMQGGIHPAYTGETYLAVCRAVKEAVPGMHVHAFSPLEVTQGAATLGVSVREFLTELRRAGLGTLPGTAAEILDDEMRAVICPDKISTDQWLSVMRTAHGMGIRSTCTIMFGHADAPIHWARHLLRLRALQRETGGFTEFIPLPFVHMEAPMYIKGRARRGPTFREAVLMHAVGRLALHPLITSVQASWVKMGRDGAAVCLRAGVNDLGGTLMNESITRAAGGQFGQEMPPEAMERLIREEGRVPRQRTTLYGEVPDGRRLASFGAPPLAPVIQTPPRYDRARPQAGTATAG